jgi:hypothetical protein
MNNWRSLPSRGGLIGIGLTLISVVVFGIVLVITLQNALAPVDAGANLGTFFLALAACSLLLIAFFLGRHTWYFFKIRYYLDRNAITIDLGSSRQIIPLATIQQFATAENLLKQLKEQIGSETLVQTKASSSEAKNFAKSPVYTTTTTEAADSSFEEDLAFTVNAPTSETKLNSDNAEEVVLEAEVISVEVLETAAGNSENPTTFAVTEKEAPAHEEVESTAEVVEAKVDEAKAEEVAPDKATEPTVPLNVEKNPALSVKMQGWYWPGYYLNTGYFPALGTIKFFSTTPFANTVVIRTAGATYAISPAEPQRFLMELKLRRTLGATERLEEGAKPGAFLSHPLWHDNLGRGLIFLGLLCNLALFFYMLLNFKNLPENVQIHFNKFGDPDRIGFAGDLMWLPFAGLVAFTVNSVVGAWVQVRDSVPAYLLYIASIVMQLLIGLALAGILGGLILGN